MNELEFRQRLYANPTEVDEELLLAASANPALQEILEETRKFEADMVGHLNRVTAPDGLVDKLRAIPDSESAVENVGTALEDESLKNKPAANNRLFQIYAVAACLLLAVGVSVSVVFSPEPEGIDIAFNGKVLEHMYHDTAEIDAINNGQLMAAMSMPAVNEVLSGSGSEIINAAFLESTAIRSAKPCVILPAYESAHLVIEGVHGAVSVFVINNSPVSVEYRFNDDRYNGVVMPLGDGNIIVVGEEGEELQQYKRLFADNVEWLI